MEFEFIIDDNIRSRNSFANKLNIGHTLIRVSCVCVCVYEAVGARYVNVHTDSLNLECPIPIARKSLCATLTRLLASIALDRLETPFTQWYASLDIYPSFSHKNFCHVLLFI